jgi:SAM-dependent methyltransferase
MSVLDPVRDYYEAKLRQHGPTPGGVDWNGEASQNVRFETLSRVITHVAGDSFSIDDYGCGYGAHFAWLRSQGFTQMDYLGIDVSPEMVDEGKKLHPEASFVVGNTSPRVADYAVASGIFNVALQSGREDWQSYILATLDAMHRSSRRGFSFNCLTSYSDAEYMRPHLHYGDPCFYFDHCKRHYSRQVALLHDYGLYEFTIIVRKDP